MTRAVVTAYAIMSAPGGPPCSNWPRAKVERVLARLDCSSWVALAESARAKKWRLVSLDDLRLTAYRAATREQRIAGARRSTCVHVDAIKRQYPTAPASVVALLDELRAWDGTAAQALGIRDRAWAERSRLRDAAYAAAVAAAVYAADAADYAAYADDADAVAAADYAADAAAYAAYAAGWQQAQDEEEWRGLLYICTLLDGGTP